MASFSQNVPDVQSPLFLNLPKATAEPKPNQSGELLFNTIGSAIKGAVGLADTFVKRSADEDVHSQMDQLQEEKNQSLSSSINAVSRGTIADEQGNPLKIQDLFSKPEADRTPNDIKNIDQIARNLRAGREHGAYSDTYYRMQVDKLAKDMRSRYPGYRDYIDEKIKSEEGSSANELASSMIKDLNAALTANKDGHDKIETLINSNLEYPEVYGIGTRYFHGLASADDVRKVVSENKAKDAAIKNRETQMTLDTKTREQEREQMDGIASQAISQKSQEAWALIAYSHGEWGTPQKAMDDLIKRSTNGEPVSDVESKQMIPLFTAAEDHYNKTTNKWLDTVTNPNDPPEQQRTRRTILGSKRSAEILQNGVQQLQDFRKNFFNGEWGMAALNKQMSDSQLNDLERGLLAENPSLQLAGAVQKIGGPQVVKDFLNYMLGTPDGLTKDMKKWSLDKTLKMVNGSPNRLQSLTSTVNEAASRNIGGAAIQYQLGAAHRLLTDPRTSPEVRYNIIQYAFGPGNDELYANIPDSSTSWTGAKIPGRTEIFKQLTDPEIIKTVKDIGNNNPARMDTWGEYKNSVTSWARNYLIADQAKLLSDLQQNDKLQSNFVDILFNEHAHRFEVYPKTLQQVLDKPGYKPINVNRQDIDGASYAAKGAVDKINEVIKSFVSIAEADKIDPNMYVMEQLKSMKYDPSTGKNRFIDAIREANKPIQPKSVKTEKARVSE
jgi:hypothetical protein